MVAALVITRAAHCPVHWPLEPIPRPTPGKRDILLLEEPRSWDRSLRRGKCQRLLVRRVAKNERRAVVKPSLGTTTFGRPEDVGPKSIRRSRNSSRRLWPGQRRGQTWSSWLLAALPWGGPTLTSGDRAVIAEQAHHDVMAEVDQIWPD